MCHAFLTDSRFVIAFFPLRSKKEEKIPGKFRFFFSPFFSLSPPFIQFLFLTSEWLSEWVRASRGLHTTATESNSKEVNQHFACYKKVKNHHHHHHHKPKSNRFILLKMTRRKCWIFVEMFCGGGGRGSRGGKEREKGGIWLKAWKRKPRYRRMWKKVTRKQHSRKKLGIHFFDEMEKRVSKYAWILVGIYVAAEKKVHHNGYRRTFTLPYYLVTSIWIKK